MNGGVGMFLEDVKRVRFVHIIRGKFALFVKNWCSLSIFKQIHLLEEY